MRTLIRTFTAACAIAAISASIVPASAQAIAVEMTARSFAETIGGSRVITPRDATGSRFTFEILTKNGGSKLTSRTAPMDTSASSTASNKSAEDPDLRVAVFGKPISGQLMRCLYVRQSALSESCAYVIANDNVFKIPPLNEEAARTEDKIVDTSADDSSDNSENKYDNPLKLSDIKRACSKETSAADKSQSYLELSKALSKLASRKSPSYAEDAAQEILLKLLSSCDDFLGYKSPVATITTSLYRKIFDMQRKSKLISKFASNIANSDSYILISRQDFDEKNIEARDLVLKLQQTLDHEEQSVLEGILSDRSTPEIAKVTGFSESAVKTIRDKIYTKARNLAN